MACYAAVLSLYHTLNNINIHPRPPISLDQQQLQSLTRNLTFFQHFLESYPTYEDDHLERCIANAAYAAEDLIEIQIVNQIHAGSHISTLDLSQALERVIQYMDSIRKEVMQIKKHKDIAALHHDHLPTNSVASGGPAASTWQSIKPVFDNAMIIEVLDKLIRQQSGLHFISVVGMGGIGKTTFATSIYSRSLVVEHFDIRAWVTISQEYSTRNILDVLCQKVGVITSALSGDEIGLELYQHLYGRRYLIVMDDIWSVEAWDKVRSFFPENNNGSRIMITTRLTNMAFQLSSYHVFQMQFLVEDKSWDLLSEIVFGKLGCPIELKDIGKEIARKCGGLPLSIAVIGGLLRKSNMTRTCWMYTLENLNLLINLDNNEYVLRLLRTSYKQLPMHLKPCFLYMGVFPEDEEIKISVLVRLLVAEGILRPIDDKSLEEVGKEYLKELIDRNLILISDLRWNGEVKFCKIHDLLRDVCLREAQKQKFLCVLWQQKDRTPQGINMERRVCINPENRDEEYSSEFLHAVETAWLTRSLFCRLLAYWKVVFISPSLHFGLLRVYFSSFGEYRTTTRSDNAIFEQANLRYLSLDFEYGNTTATWRLLSLCSLLWNLQTLEVWGWLNSPEIASKIWEMPLLRHVMLEEAVLLDPPNGEHNYVLENLQNLKGIKNLKFSEEMVKRIPNIKKLDVSYHRYGLEVDYDEGLPDFCLHNLGRLQKLESLRVGFSIICPESFRAYSMSFPHSLKKLSLKGTKLNWEELTIKICPLPLLQFLKLDKGACVGPRWKTVEGQFCSLRVLQIWYCEDLKYWETDGAHFPRLEYLSLHSLRKLKEIPSSIGDIPTLKAIGLDCCSRSAADSARRIKEEQEENGNEDLQVVIRDLSEGNEETGLDEEEEEDDEDSEEEDDEDSEEEDEEDYLHEEDQVVSDVYVGHRIVQRWQRQNSFP